MFSVVTVVVVVVVLSDQCDHVISETIFADLFASADLQPCTINNVPLFSSSLLSGLEGCHHVSNNHRSLRETTCLSSFSFPYLFSFGTLAAGLQIRVDIDIN